MRITLLFGCCLFLTGLFQNKALVIDQTEIIVKGRTTIGSFECSYESQDKRDTLLFDLDSSEFSTLDFNIPISDFGCGNFLLNRDFMKTLKADVFPNCLVSVSKLRRGPNKLYGDIYLQMAGKDHLLKEVAFHHLNDKFQGILNLSMEELGLNASSRLGGLVKIEESIDLTINLYL
ncbi:hypothetical protein [Cyclobacterium marinum]|uniref:YceI family protein n=1 Tax=Cyclobacterium marinum (strain ATCC 25205 / DSM 745 / LMG 13164 / NCIMB 1802) TaxID=880070 RepID=G0J485_CYCMS|nr:hypothetical protein [Cyclobacterium marinum]AEL27511.1 hypothetical protein Cycma_3800 [Cyclobacterium marinum DSM 745]MBR9778094.1 hypothetical protein [Cytophagales bacterium]|tara:strand:- start:20178 stop:20705 length:528 start_codon:yes stop_codon:yes gene_type:complete